MKQVFATGGRVVVLDVAEPTLRSGEVLVAPAFSVISAGTELFAIRSTARPETAGNETYPSVLANGPPPLRIRAEGTRWAGPDPRPARADLVRIGYSLAGTILEVGSDVLDLKPGDLVACSGNQCALHAERVTVPRNLVARIPAGVPLERAAFVTLGSIALNAIRRAGCQLGEAVGVFGLGLIGLLAVQIARAGVLDVLGVDLNNRRVTQARSLGANVALNPTESDAVAAARELTGGFGLDAVLMCVATESSEPLNLAFDLTRQRGCVVGVGAFGMEISRDRMYAHDVIFYPALAYGPGRYDPIYEEGNVDYPIGYVRWTENRNQTAFLRLLADDRVKVDSLAPIHVPLSDAPRAFDLLQSPDRPATVVLTY